MFSAVSCALVIAVAPQMVVALGPEPPRARPDGIPTFQPATSGKLDSATFVQWVKQQVDTGIESVALKEGEYKASAGFDDAHVKFDSLVGIELWMDGINMTMSKDGLTGFSISNCTDFIIHGPTMWWDLPGFSQATISEVKRTGDGSTPGNGDYDVTIHLDAGYDPKFLLDTTTNQLDGQYTDPKTGRLAAGNGWSRFSGTASQVPGKPNYYTFSATNLYFIPQVGYKLLARGDFVHCNHIDRSTRTVINDFTILNCAGFNFLLTGNHMSTFNSLSIKPADFAPPGGTELPARSSSADGVHSVGDFIGPTLNNCFFSALDDDCVAVHGNIFDITGNADSPDSILTSNMTGPGIGAPGELVEFYTKETYELLGSATIKSVDTKVVSSGTSTTIIFTSVLPESVTSQLTSTKWYNTARVGSGFVLFNSHTTGNRGRGIIAKASDGIIEGNLFEGVSYGAITLGPEFAATESGYVHNLIIKNNIVRDCNYLSLAGSAVQLHGEGSPGAKDLATGMNSNVTVDGLTIDDTSASNLLLEATDGVSIKNVKFENAYRRNYSLWEINPGALITINGVSFNEGSQLGCVSGGIGREGVSFVNIKGTVTGLDEIAKKMVVCGEDLATY